MSPEKIAIAVAVTIAAIAGIGDMKNVTGTRSAVAIVAVRPGTAPTNKPKSDAPSIASRLCGWKTRPKACIQASLTLQSLRCASASPRETLQDAPRQRHAQQLVERVVNDQRHDDGERQDPASAHAEHPAKRREIDHAHDAEAEPLDERDVDDVDPDDD